ncbi:DUF397 domain-containing protein [Kitasatospora sp. NPDC001309]|uniref:DUF397 domain-containing protein n=1 Tax=Kitasatospora sp. NPDC001309 TaxID=3364013 RepID=UPI00368861FD
MPEIFDNGVPGDSIPTVWVKAPQSMEQGDCVELAPLPGGGLAIRNSRFPGGPALVFTGAEAVAFAQGVKSGAFDHLIPAGA